MDYFEVIKRAAEITWKNKYLWVLGFIVALAAGGSSASNSLQYSSGNSDYSSIGSSFSNFAAAYLVFIIFLAIVIFVIGLVVWVMSIFAQAGLIYSVNGIEDGNKMSLAAAFRAGGKYFWRVLGLNIIVGLIVVLLVFIVVIPFALIIAAVASGGLDNSAVVATFVCVILAFVLAILAVALAAVFVGVVSLYALRLIVLRDMGVIASLRSGFAIVKSYKGPTFVTFLLVMLVSGLVGALLSIPGLIIGLPAVIMMIGGLAAENIGVVTLGIFGLMLAGVLQAVFNGVLEVYRSSVWTLTYRQLDTK